MESPHNSQKQMCVCVCVDTQYTLIKITFISNTLSTNIYNNISFVNELVIYQSTDHQHSTSDIKSI